MRMQPSEDLGDVIRRLIPDGAVLLKCTHEDFCWWRANGQGYTSSQYTAALYGPDSRASEYAFYGEHRAGDHSVKYPAIAKIGGEPPPGSIVELMAKRILALESQHAASIARIEELERERTSITNVVGLVPGASVESIRSSINRLRHEIGDAKETLAAYCPEMDPTRCSLAGVVASLMGDVLDPSEVRIATLESEAATLESEAATLRGILASVPAPEDDQ